MILRRIAQHLKQQHWTGVFIELVIVVIGVFLGMQVSNWNDARKTHERARAYTRQLRNDLRVEYAHSRSLLAYDADALQAAKAAYDGLTKQRRMKDRTILVNAYRATQFQWYERHSAAYDELLSAGELDLVTDPILRNTAVRYYGNSQTTLELTLQDRRDSDYRRLFYRRVSPFVQIALQKDCGDRAYTLSNGISGLLSIGYPCNPSVDDATVGNAADVLRSDPEVLPALRHQITVYNVEINNLTYLLDETGMRSLFAKEKME